jgi:putative sugar O-methyltransferase
MIKKILKKFNFYLNRLLLFRFEKSIVKSGEHASSTSDNGWYIRSIEGFLKSNKKFKRFKRSPAYREVLEHVSYEQACDYIKRIEDLSPNYLEKESIENISINDVIGSPILFEFPKYISLSGPTLRYLYVCSHLSEFFNLDEVNDIAEIGAGYGGQALIYNQLFSYQMYNIFDLEPVCRLIEKYLGNFYLSGGISASDINTFPLRPLRNFDLVISNYAFSELPKKLQKIYLDKVILRSKRGYLTMNTGNDLNGPARKSRYNCTELLKMLPNSRVVDENPLTADRNYIIIWGED